MTQQCDKKSHADETTILTRFFRSTCKEINDSKILFEYLKNLLVKNIFLTINLRIFTYLSLYNNFTLSHIHSSLYLIYRTLRVHSFVVDSMSFIIFASFVTFVSTLFVIVVSISFVMIVFAFYVMFFFVFASLDESIVNSIFEEMNRDILIRFLTILISFSIDFFLKFTSAFVADLTSIRITISI
jgi:hypothetical protein